MGAEVSVLIARGANSARHVGWVVVVAGGALGERNGVRSFGRLKVLELDMLGSRRRILG